MNLLIAADIFPPDSGGPATYVVTLSNAFTARGISVRIVSLNPHSDTSVVSCPVLHVSSNNKFFRYLQYLWLLICEARTADVVYAMGPVNAGVPALIAAWAGLKPLVVKVVGDYAWEQGVNRFGVQEGIDNFQKAPHSGAVGLLRRAQSFVVQRARRVIAPCRYLKTLADGWGVEAKNIAVIYNAAEQRAVAPAQKPNDERWIVSAGRLVPWKGMIALIDVVAGLRDTAPDLRLKIIGDGPERNKLDNRVRNLQALDRVELLGALSHEQTCSLIGAADVFVLNSGYEGLSHVLLEAIALGVPVVASRAGGNTEIIPEDRLFSMDARDEMRAKILLALADPTLVVLGDAFAMQKMIDRTQEVLVSVTRDV